MEIISKTDFLYQIKHQDFEFVKDYLVKFEKKAHGSYLNKKWIIGDCLNFIKKEIEKIKITDIKNYLEVVIDNKVNKRTNKGVKLNTKETYRSYLKSFFNYVQKMLLGENIIFYNPVPGKEIYEFSQHVFDIKKQSKIELEVFSTTELSELLNKAKKKSFRDFILFSLLVSDGARISEILTIKIENINLEERFFETGFEKGARKSTRNAEKGLLFFIPEGFIPFLKKYIHYIGTDQVWLFPGRKSHYNYDSFHDYARRNYGPHYSKFHRYRKTLITNRVKKFECPLWISEGLMNHKSTSIEGEHYIKLNIEEKRNLFDKYFPYYEFPYF